MADSTVPAPPPGDGLARPRNFDARYGDGLGLGVSLGGGGVFFVAWQVGYLHELAERGVELAGADRVVGTSAGALVASLLEAGHVRRFRRTLSVVARVPRVLGALAPAGNLHPSQERARSMFTEAAGADPETIRAIGHASLAAQTPAASVMVRNAALVLGSRKWPSPGLQLTCVDAHTGERCVVTASANVGIARAVAASSAVPGLFAPQQIGDRRCMDGGVSGTGTHLDLLAGARRAVVLALTAGEDVTEGAMTTGPGTHEHELAALRASGCAVFLRQPESVDVGSLMQPGSVPGALSMGRRQAAADAEGLRAFLA